MLALIYFGLFSFARFANRHFCVRLVGAILIPRS